MSASSSPRTERVAQNAGIGAKFGVWMGFSAWWIVFALITIPHTGTFAWAIVGAAILSSFLAWLVVRRLQQPAHLGRLLGAVLVCSGLLLAYHSLAIQPLFDAEPAIEERLRSLGSVTRVPWGLGATIAGAGAVVLAWQARR